MKWFVLYQFISGDLEGVVAGVSWAKKKPSSGAKAHSLRARYAGAESPGLLKKETFSAACNVPRRLI
jgi:hypothetical protein